MGFNSGFKGLKMETFYILPTQCLSVRLLHLGFITGTKFVYCAEQTEF